MSFKRQGIVATAILAAAATTAALVPATSSATSAPPQQRSLTAAVDTATQAAAAVEARRQGTIKSRVRGEFGRAGVVRGTFDPKRFIVKRGETFAVGRLHATLRRGNGTLVGKANRTIVIPVRNGSTDSAVAGDAARAAPCRILRLVLGPLDLNLLGLKVDLNRVVLLVRAIPGAGNLLGNLLCAVAGLLDPPGLLGQLRLANVLNRILSILRV